MEMKLELVAVPVSDVDRAKSFCTEKVGFNADVDHQVVKDIATAYDHLKKRGVAVSDIEVMPWGSFVFFSDPDGNKWALQQLPPRGPS